MLKHTFLHLPGIGYTTERKLWANGFLSWQAYLDGSEHCPVLSSIRSRHSVSLGQSVKALAADDARYFEMRLPPAEVWRLYCDFGPKAAFIDIETTGLYQDDAITVIGLFDGTRTKSFIKGINLEDFPGEISKYSLIITFNGKRFDVPFLNRAFGEPPENQAHLDLLYPLRKLGYRGGLKSIEAQLGLEREGALKEVDGFMATRLWQEYKHGNRAALDTLLRYNLEDVVNLQYLAGVVYNQASAGLPIEVEPLPLGSKYALDIPFDPDLVHYLRRKWASFSGW